MNTLSNEVLSQLFTEARTHNGWLPKDVPTETLHKLYDLTKFGPTSVNMSPARFIFVKSPSEKDKLNLGVAEMNQQKVKSAPVTVIIATDEKFYEHLPKLFPHAPDIKNMFTADAKMASEAAFRNSTLQGAYFMIAARALGLDCGPMSGFNNAKVDELFFKGTTWKSNFLCNIGFGDKAKLFPRLPRLTFEESCKIV